MTNTGLPSRQLGLIELHDARIASISLRPGGALEILFSHIVVFFEIKPLLYEVCSHQATLQLDGTQRFELHGTIAANDYVMDDRLTLPNGDRGEWVDLLDERGPLADIVLSFFFGARVSISAQSGLLTLQSEGRFLETWEGPLGDDPES